MTKAINKLPLLFAGIVFVICIAAIEFIPVSNYWIAALIRFGLAALSIGLTYIINRRNVFAHPFKNFKEVFFDCAYPVGVSLFAGAATIIQGINEYTISETAVIDIASILFLCISVGLFEEGLFRLALGDAAIAQFGKSKKSLIIIALITSFIFGFIHVAFDINLEVLQNKYAMLSVLFKTIQAMEIGFLFIVVFWKTKSFVGIALMHCLNDIFAMVPLALYGQAMETSYITTDETAIVGYIVVLLLYIPIVGIGVRVLKEIFRDIDKEKK